MGDPAPVEPLPAGALRAEIQSRALKLLTTREHSRLELARKLRQRGYPAPEVEAVIDALVADDLLSEERLIAAYVAERLAKGFGPVRIRFELREKGLSDEQIQPYLDQEEEILVEYLRLAYRKRFGDEPIGDRRELAKRSRFLEYRGFPPHLIARFLTSMQSPQ
ncbi:regulatory protein RecX [Lamprobacter modestohalophilus]|uniref:regulatory protein RecX n=1 Tax=Lamprobacter modestohalophilus TaxID=1064514 RepID=UPI002ADED5DE|nr:regulatory protein RecX [Lamprobacter modestohalophilus]MEA1048810.1 regulatory protein RecX [Lamprobacter modestohalophilus]